MPRFFVPQDAVSDGTVTVTGNDALHIARALRMAVGEEITVCTPDGTGHTCRLSRIRDEEVTAEILSSAPGETEPPLKIRLFMAYPKGDKLETIVQKAVELGAASVTPFDSERCIRRPRPEKIAAETLRLNRIAHEAAKQCGRSVLPSVTSPLSFREMLAAAGESDFTLFCYEGEGTEPLTSLLGKIGTPGSLSVVVGSEGGFSPEEAAHCREAGFLMCGLGRRILRCETAPLVALSGILFCYELA